MKSKWPFLIYYRYKLATAHAGRLKQGGFFARSQEEARKRLIVTGLKIISLEADLPATLYGFFAGYTLRDKSILSFFSDMHNFLKEGLNIDETLEAIVKTNGDQPVKRLVVSVKEDLAKGLSLSEALRRPQILPEMVAATIKAGEHAGALEKVAEFLEDFYRRKTAFTQEVQKALFYPGLVLIFTMAALLFISLNVLPKFEATFTLNSFQLPAISRMVFATGNFINRFWLVLTGVMVLFIFAAKNYLSGDQGGKVMERIYALPGAGLMIKEAVLSVIFRNFAVLEKSGVPVHAGIDLLAHSVSQPLLAQKLSCCSQALSRGQPLSQAFREDKFFPETVALFLQKGEIGGEMARSFEALANLYENRTNARLNRLEKIVEPVFLVLLGGIILSIYLAFFLVLYPGLNSMLGKSV